MPVEESVLLALLHDKIRERDIPARSIRQWTDPKLSVYIATVTVKPSGRQRTDRERGAFLLKQTLKWALSLNRQCDIKNWYGIGATKERQHLFESLGFREIVSLYDGERKGYCAEDIQQPTKLINRLLAEMNRPDTQKEEVRDSQAERTRKPHHS